MTRQRRPTLVLLDLDLPDIPGEQVLARLKADQETNDIPVVIVSADVSAGQLERLKARGAASYVPKPFDVDELLAVVDRLGQASIAEAAV